MDVQIGKYKMGDFGLNICSVDDEIIILDDVHDIF